MDYEKRPFISQKHQCGSGRTVGAEDIASEIAKRRRRILHTYLQVGTSGTVSGRSSGSFKARRTARIIQSSPVKLATLALSALVLGLATGPATALEQPAPVSQTTLRSPGAYQFLLGDFRVVALTDGTVSVPFDQLLHGEPAPTLVQTFRAAGQSPDRETSINAFIVDTGKRRILIESGAGGLFGECCGRLPETLTAAGYPLETIDVVLLTHVHGDHSGGLTRDGRRVFPNADVYLDRRELEYWMSDVEKGLAKPAHADWFDQGRAALAPYQAAGRVRTFDGATQLFEGVRAIPAPGHTPGHSVYEIESQDHRLRVIGDMIHAVEIQLADPTVTIDYDADEAKAAVTREAALAELADSQELVAAPHISFPGLGHIYRAGDGFAWAPLPYAFTTREEGGRGQVQRDH